MDKEALHRKLHEIHKALCLEIDESWFTPLYTDVTDWKSWNALHAIAEAYDCDVDYISLIEECLTKTARHYLGDKY